LYCPSGNVIAKTPLAIIPIPIIIPHKIPKKTFIQIKYDKNTTLVCFLLINILVFENLLIPLEQNIL